MAGNAVIKLRRDAAADWTAADPTLALGEPGVETDTGKLKIGDGVTAWSSLAYFTSPATTIVGITGTKAQFNAAVTDGDILFVGDITQYTDELAQDAVGGILTDTATIDFTYNDGAPSITADVKAGSITLAMQADMATASVVYRKTAGAGAPEVQSLATLKTDLGLTGTNSGDQTSIVGITGTLAEFNTALTGADFATGGGTATGTNTGDQTSIVGISGTKAEFDTACSDGNFLYVGDITQYTDELAQDAIGAMIDSSLTYVDATPLLQRAALTGHITAAAGSNATVLGSFTLAQLNTAVSDANIVPEAGGAFTGAVTFINSSGIKIQDTDASHTLGIIGGSNLTANRTLTVTTGDANRVLTMTGDASITGTNTGDQTSIVGITGTKAQFDTAVTDANLVAEARNINTTAPITGGGDLSADRTIAISAATTGAAGSMSAADKIKADAQLSAQTGLAGAIGPTIADYFSGTVSLEASSTYEITCHAYFLKTTAGTVLFTWLFSSAPTMASSRYQSTPVTGFTTSIITGAEVFAEATAEAVAALAHAASASLTTAVRHSFFFTLLVRTNAATTLQLRATSSAGTVTPQTGSYIKAIKIV